MICRDMDSKLEQTKLGTPVVIHVPTPKLHSVLSVWTVVNHTLTSFTVHAIGRHEDTSGAGAGVSSG